MKSAMTTRLPLRSKFESGLAIFRAHRSGEFSNAPGSVSYYRELRGYLEQYAGVPLKGARVLDMGCGQTATMSLVFRAEGAHVTGIDIEVPTPHGPRYLRRDLAPKRGRACVQVAGSPPAVRRQVRC